MARATCYACRTTVRTMAEHLTTERHRMATTSVRSSGPKGSHAYRPAFRMASDAAYDAMLAERYRDTLPPSIDDVFPLEVLPPELVAGDDSTRTVNRSLAEAAGILGLSPNTLRHQVAAGRLRAQLIGKTWVTDDEAIAEYRDRYQGRVGRPAGSKDRQPRTRRAKD